MFCQGEVEIMKKTNLTQGPILKNLVLFSIPLIITSVVQILFHATDVAVLGLMSDDYAVAAVGACGTITTLLVSLCTALSAGANVIVARKTGAADEDGVRRASGTAVVTGFVSGVVLMVIALIFARDFLVLMKCSPEVLDMATLYMRIYFIGMPVTMLYNFSASILRARGDSTRPMIYMLISGVLNVVMNVFFIAVLKMTVDGVAVATVLSKAVSLVLILIALFKKNGTYKMKFTDLKIHGAVMGEMIKIAIPTLLCSMSFYLANAVLSACVNSMGADAMAANAISGQFDGIIYQVGASIASAASVMQAQNLGAKKIDRINNTMRTALLYATVASLFLGITFVLISEPLLGIMTDSDTVIAIAKDRMTLLCLTYFITSIMEVFSFSLRALRHQTCTMIVGFTCGLCIRCAWAWLIWPLNKTLSMLFSCIAVSASVASVIYFFVYLKAIKDLKKGISLGV